MSAFDNLDMQVLDFRRVSRSGAGILGKYLARTSKLAEGAIAKFENAI